jgi:hypothetical protein
LLHPELATERTLKEVEKQNRLESRQHALGFVGNRSPLGDPKNAELPGFLKCAQAGREWFGDDDEIRFWADLARPCVHQIKLALRFSIRPGMSNIRIVHQLLS